MTISEERQRLYLTKSVGGLTSGLSDYLDSPEKRIINDYLWFGWPGAATADNHQLTSIVLQFEKNRNYPIFISCEQIKKFYYGFCKETIWPLFHDFPGCTLYQEENWNHYQQVNETFCDIIIKQIEPNDIIWVHDYHFMLLPRMLKRKKPDTPVGFFLHIPFPAVKYFCVLPKQCRMELLEGMLGADTIGFHINEYKKNFFDCVAHDLGYKHKLDNICHSSHTSQAKSFPMGINFSKYNNATKNPDITKHGDDYRQKKGESRWILSVNRLDYVKGVAKSLAAYDHFLEKNTKWHGKVKFMLLIAPSRIQIQNYQHAKEQIDELIGKINGRYGDLDWTPVQYQFQFTPFENLAALYSVCDVALLTSLRDGMNLVAKEYIATRRDKTGVLLLSELAGAANELKQAMIVNPYNSEEIADALNTALHMPISEQVVRNQAMQRRLRRNDVFCWANSFIRSLLDTETGRGFVRRQDQQHNKTGFIPKYLQANVTPSAPALNLRPPATQLTHMSVDSAGH